VGRFFGFELNPGRAAASAQLFSHTVTIAGLAAEFRPGGGALNRQGRPGPSQPAKPEAADRRSAEATGGRVTRGLQNLTNAVNSRFAKDPSVAMRVLSEAEVNKAIAEKGPVGGFNQLYGHALERLVAMEVVKDPFLSQHLEYIPNVKQTAGNTGDFRGVNGATGLVFDVTTPGQAVKKQNNGKDFTFITYQRLFEGPK
jgi:hypothetical protein